jgi:hypothetical protein
VQTLFRCGDADTLRTLTGVSTLMQVLNNGVRSPALRFKEYGTDTVSNVMNAVAPLFGAQPLYQPGDVAYVRGVSLTSGRALHRTRDPPPCPRAAGPRRERPPGRAVVDARRPLREAVARRAPAPHC